MSEWYEPTDDDIELDWKNEQVDIHVTHSRRGNVYASLSFEQIRKLAKEIEDKP